MLTIAQIYRKLVDPRSRRTRSTAIIHSGGEQTIYGCVCGATHTAATRYRGTTRHEREWRHAHRSCMVEAVAVALPDPSLASLAEVR